MSSSPARPAETEFDVAMTVARLMAAAVLRGNPRAKWRSGTRKRPPPIPNNAPILPAAAPNARMTSATGNVTAGIV
jgi:hypothetical protein